MLVIEPSTRRILINYLDSQDFYKISPDVLFFRKKLEQFILFLAKTIAVHRNHDYLEPRDMKASLVVYFHLITAQDIASLLNIDQIDTSKLFVLHQLPLFSFYRNLIRRKLSYEAEEYVLAIQDRMKRILENINELKKKQKKEMLDDYINALEILGYLQEKNNPKIILTKRLLEKSQYFIKKILFDSKIISEIETLYNLYRLLKNSQLLMNLCLIEIPWDIQKFLQHTHYYKTDLRISKILRHKNFGGLEYNRHLLVNLIQFLSVIYALKQNVYIDEELFDVIFQLCDKLVLSPRIEQIEHIQIKVFPTGEASPERQIQDFLFTAFKKDSTKEARDYLLQLKKWFAHLLVKNLGRKELLLNHPKFIIQITTVLVFLAYRSSYFAQHSKIEQSDVKTAYNQLSYLLLDAKFSYLK